MRHSNDSDLIEWVIKTYPKFGIILEQKIRKTYSFRDYAAVHFIAAPNIAALAELVRFDIPPLAVFGTYNKKGYNKLIKSLRDHIKGNPDVILFILL